MSHTEYTIKYVINQAIELTKNKHTCQIKDIIKLAAHTLSIEKEKILFFSEDLYFSQQQKEIFFAKLHRYINDEPISKIINSKGFWTHNFFVNNNVLDPRPETELIVEYVLKNYTNEVSWNILDIGTGSGCIIISILNELKNSYATAIDISIDALSVAKLNAENIGTTNVNFLHKSWLDINEKNTYDIIISNPPYIKSSDIPTLDANVKKYDPILALDGGETGITPYYEIAKIAKTALKNKGKLIFEVGFDQADAVTQILYTEKFHEVFCIKDLNDINRVVIGIL